MTEQVITRRAVAQAARQFGRDAGLDGFGSRGRVSANLVFQYLGALEAKSVREIATDLHFEVSPKGKISEAELLALAVTVTSNTPKEDQDADEA
jgi:hypothetical protein